MAVTVEDLGAIESLIMKGADDRVKATVEHITFQVQTREFNFTPLEWATYRLIENLDEKRGLKRSYEVVKALNGKLNTEEVDLDHFGRVSLRDVAHQYGLLDLLT